MYFLFKEGVGGGGSGLKFGIRTFWFALGVDGEVPENIHTLPDEGSGAKQLSHLAPLAQITQLSHLAQPT